jgi:signal transduction histidine kinase
MQIKNSFLTTLLLLTCFFVSSQTLEEVIEYTKNKLNIEESIKTKAKLSGDLSWYYATLSVDSSYKYGYQSLGYARQIKNDTLIAQAYNDLGTVYFIKGDYITSQEYCRQSYKIRKAQKDFKGLASLHVKIANNFNRMAQYDSSMFYYLKAHSYFEEVKDLREQMNIESNISAAYLMMGNNEKAIEYLQKPIKYYGEIEDFALLSNAIANLGNIYYSTGDTINAVKSYERAEMEALKVNNYHALGVAYNNLGEIYSKKKEQEKAVNYILKSIKIREGAGSETDLASSYLTLAFNYFRMGEFDKAKTNLLRTVPVFENSKSKEKLDDVYLLLSYVFAAEGKFDSLNYYSTKFYEARSNNIREHIISSTQDIEARYQTEKKEKELLESRAVIAENELKIRRKNALIYGTTSLTLIFALLGYLLFNQQKLKNRQLQKEAQLKEALSLIATQNQLQEQRLRISRDLHDNIGAQLTFIISTLDNIKYGFKLQNDKLGEKLQSISNFTSNTIFELRDTIWAMNKPEITFEDLNARITNFIDKARETTEKTNFSFEISEELCNKQLFSSVEGMNIYRVIQESVHNALKYAEAKNISVKIDESNEAINIVIEDDGKGFDFKNIQMGNGLNNLRKRAKEINSTIKVDSIPGKGTIIKLVIKKDNFKTERKAS